MMSIASIPSDCLRVDLTEAQRIADGPGYTWVMRKHTYHAKAA